MSVARNRSTTWTSPTTATLSSDTQLEWLEKAYTWRRWYGRRAFRGIWFATHTRFPGAWGEGATPEVALDDLATAIGDILKLRWADGGTPQ